MNIWAQSVAETQIKDRHLNDSGGFELTMTIFMKENSMKTKLMNLFCLIFIPILLALCGASVVSAGNNPPGGKACAKGDTNCDQFMADSKESRFEVAKSFNSHSQTKSTTLATAIDAYIYGYPLILEEFTRQVMLASGQLKAMNQFTSTCYLLEPDDQDVKRPNNDTLYSQAFLDLSTEPLILKVPDTTGFYYVLQIMDAWTNTFSAPGTRTTGSSPQEFAIVGPDWKGHLPRPMKVIKSPTNMVWIIGRTQVKTDYPPEGTCLSPSYEDVWEIMQHYTLTSLSQWPDTEPSPLYCDDIPSVTSHLTPSELVAQLTGVEFFQMLSDLMRDNPAAYQDKPALKKFEAIDFVPGAPFNPPENMVADINKAPINAILLMNEQWQTLGDSVNAWRVTVSDIGTYGTNYLTRAAVALHAPGANIPEDGFYPSTFNALETIDGQIQAVQLNGSKKYIIHLDPVPPVKAFWSITVYDTDGLLVANPICRYAIHSTDQAIEEGQTSVEILLQADKPTDPERIGFWLPIPGLSPDMDHPELANFSLTLRMYWPDKTALKGKWVPPPVLIQQ